MLKCGYCYTDNVESATQCGFCEAPLQVHRPIFNEPYKFTEDDIYYATYHSLKNYNHVELLNLLVLAKNKKVELLQQDNEKEIEKFEHVLVKTIHLIENMIFDKMGRVPKKLGKTELKRISDGRRTRLYTHNQNMQAKSTPIHHHFIINRFSAKW